MKLCSFAAVTPSSGAFTGIHNLHWYITRATSVYDKKIRIKLLEAMTQSIISRLDHTDHKHLYFFKDTSLTNWLTFHLNLLP